MKMTAYQTISVDLPVAARPLQRRFTQIFSSWRDADLSVPRTLGTMSLQTAVSVRPLQWSSRSLARTWSSSFRRGGGLSSSELMLAHSPPFNHPYSMGQEIDCTLQPNPS
jgi:hypothetical protein